MTRIEVCVLGGIELWVGGRRAALAGTRAPALLALLAMHAGRPVSVDEIVAQVWGGAPPGRSGAAGLAGSPGPANVANAVQARVSALRRLAGRDAVRGGAAGRGDHPSPDGVRGGASDGGSGDVPDGMQGRVQGYLLAVEPEAVDAVRFERGVAAGRRALATGDHAGASELLADAIGLWRGEPYPGLSPHGFARKEAARLGELRLAALHDRMEAELACGRHEELAPEMAELTAEHPEIEAFWAQRMLALYRSGRQADSLRVYHEARAALRDRYGLDPGARLRELQAAVLAQADGLAAPHTTVA